ITAASTLSPRYASASVFSFWRIIALISGGEYCLPPASTRASPFGPRTTVNGTIVSSSFTSASLRPMKRLIENTVFSGLVTAWRFATVPTRRSPLAVNATTDGVVRAPSAFSMTRGSPPSSTAMHELVVPRSMPIVFAIWLLPPVGKNLSLCIATLDANAQGLSSSQSAVRSAPLRTATAHSSLRQRTRRPEPWGHLHSEDRGHYQSGPEPVQGGEAVAVDVAEKACKGG